jgi:hypothetical protein
MNAGESWNFFAGAELYITRKQTKHTAFMRNQAAEQALHTMFECNTDIYILPRTTFISF